MVNSGKESVLPISPGKINVVTFAEDGIRSFGFEIFLAFLGCIGATLEYL